MAFLSKLNRVKSPGIDLMETVTIGGISQVLYFRGEDTKKPVILKSIPFAVLKAQIVMKAGCIPESLVVELA